MERRKRFGPYFILKSLEQGPKFGVRVPKYPTDDPNYRIVARQRSRYTHYDFYIRDELMACGFVGRSVRPARPAPPQIGRRRFDSKRS